MLSPPNLDSDLTRGGEGHGSHWLERPDAEGSVVSIFALQLVLTASIFEGFEYIWIDEAEM
jgi:hypothetical protein